MKEYYYYYAYEFWHGRGAGVIVSHIGNFPLMKAMNIHKDKEDFLVTFWSEISSEEYESFTTRKK